MNRISVINGDITELAVDAIVNAANSSLMGGGGVDGAIHRVGGPKILEECKEIIAKQGSCLPGEAVITTGGNLPAKYVIHTVGPVWNDGKFHESILLANCYKKSLEIAVRHGIQTIAFPNISTGVFRYPKDKAAKIATETVSKFLESDESMEKVFFVCYDQENYELYQQMLDEANQISH